MLEYPSMFAIVELGGKQYRVQEKDIVSVEKIETQENKNVIIDKVLLIADGKETKIGMPFIPGASIEVKVLKTVKGDKVRTFKMKSKKRYKRTKNFRPIYSDIEIVKINL